MFKITPASIMSTSRRRIIYGVGINDATYNTQIIIDNKRVTCPLYQQWKAMLQRCYCNVWQEKYPTYINCTVDSDWLVFSNFENWARKLDWKNKNLDKDLLIKNNKHYSPETCLWVPAEINKIVLNSIKRRGIYPIGVSKIKNSYIARLSKNGKSISIGCYKTIHEAATAFLNAKADYILQVARLQKNPLKKALLSISTLIRQGRYYD